MDDLARAYAALGVAPGSSLQEVRKRYKALVRKWHPDRHATDPQGQAEATLRMRAINDAFRTVAGSRVVRAPDPPADAYTAPRERASSSTAEPRFGRRLTREEIDRMVESMRNDGPLDFLLEADASDVGKVVWKTASVVGAVLTCLALLQFCRAS